MAVAAVGTPDEPSKADLLRALHDLQDRFMAEAAELRRRVLALPDLSPPARAAEPLPPGLDELPPMRGFLVGEPD